MNLPERHDREVFIHNQKEDRQFMDYEKAREQAIKNVDDLFNNNQEYFTEQMREYGPDILWELAGEFFEGDPTFLASRLVSDVYEAHKERAVENEIRWILEEGQ